MLIGKTSASTEIDFSVTSEIRLKNTLEVALVLDNSGSMDEEGTGTSEKRIELLREAAKELVEKLALQASQMKQIDKPVQFALVPFSASVNVAPVNDDKTWMDTTGISPIHHENFDWSKMTEANSAQIGNRWAEKVGDVWYKRGAGWGESENQPLTRFSLYSDMTVESGPRGNSRTRKEYICTELAQQRHLQRQVLDRSDYTYITSRFAIVAGLRRGAAGPLQQRRRDAGHVATRRRFSCRCSLRTRPSIAGGSTWMATAISTMTVPT